MKGKRLIALLLCLLMLVSLLPAAFAEGEIAEDEEIVYADDEISEEAPEEEETPAADEAIGDEEEESAADEIADDELIADDEIPEEPEEEAEENEFEAASGTCGENLNWTLDDEGLLTISGSGAMSNYTSSEPAPWSSYTVSSVIIESGATSIGSYAFYRNASLASVSIPASVTVIGKYAFYKCTALSGVNIHDAVTGVGAYCFNGCSALTSMTLPVSLTSIGTLAFDSCGFELINYNGTKAQWKAIGYETELEVVCSDGSSFGTAVATGSCGENLTWDLLNNGTLVISGSGEMGSPWDSWDSYISDISAIRITEGVTGVGGFNTCHKAKTVTISSSVTSIHDSAFSGLYELASITIPDRVTSIGNSAFSNCYCLTSVTIPDSVTSIGDRVFYNCRNMTSITIGNGVKTLGDNVFCCEKLTSITIPSSVTSIGSDPFGACPSISQINVAAGNTCYKSVDGVLYSYDGTTIIQYPRGKSETGYTVPAGVTSIGGYAFSSCNNLTSITIPGSVTSIGDYAFDYCSKLKYVFYDGSEEELNAITGSNNNSLNKAYIHYNSTGQHNYADGVCTVCGFADEGTTVGNGKCGDNLLWTLDSNGLLTIRGSGAMYDYVNDCMWSYGGGGIYSHLDWYSSAPWFSYRAKIVTIRIEDGVSKISDYAFVDCHNLTSITFSDTLSSIGTASFGYDIFYDCRSLRCVFYAGGEEEWSSVSGSGSSYLASAGIHYNSTGQHCLDEGVCTVCGFADTAKVHGRFADNLTWTLLSDGKLIIRGSGAMSSWREASYVPWNSYNTSITKIVISGGVTNIGNYSFNGCSSLTDISIPDSVTSIGDYSFQDCSKLANVTISGNVTRIGINAFRSCSGLTSITLPASVKTIDTFAFYGCSNLTSAVIAGNATGIYNKAFGECKSLKAITFKGDAPNCDGYVFLNVTATAYYPAGNSTWTSSVMQQYGGTITWKAGSPPSVPVNKTAPVISSLDNHADYMIVRWGKVEGATGYKLAYRAGSGAWQTMNVSVNSVDGKGNPRVNIKGLTTGTTYTFIAYAIFADGTQTKSASATQIRLLSPAVKVNKYGTTAANGGFKVSWNATEGGSQYKIYYREKGTSSWTLYAKIPKSANTLFVNIKGSVTNADSKFPDLVAGKTYEFAVLTATSQAGITSGFPTSYTGYKF